MKTLNPITREAVVTVRGGPSGLAQTVETRSHRLTADEPIDSGGVDSGPTPYELLVAALGT
jgi:putative redox protein